MRRARPAAAARSSKLSTHLKPSYLMALAMAEALAGPPKPPGTGQAPPWQRGKRRHQEAEAKEQSSASMAGSAAGEPALPLAGGWAQADDWKGAS